MSEEDWSRSPVQQRTRAQKAAALAQAARMRSGLSSEEDGINCLSSISDDDSAPSELVPLSAASGSRRNGSVGRSVLLHVELYANISSSPDAATP